MRAIAKLSRKFLFGLLLSCLAIIMLAPAPEAMEFPREGVPEIPNGLAEPFSGRWWLGFPEGTGTINGEPVVDCSSAVELTANGADKLSYKSSSGIETEFELMSFSGRTTWLPEWGESSIAVWVSKDEFFVYSVDLATGKARWGNPMVFRRC